MLPSPFHLLAPPPHFPSLSFRIQLKDRPTFTLRLRSFELEFSVCVGRDHSSPEIESQGHKSRSKIMSNVNGRGNAETRSV